MTVIDFTKIAKQKDMDYISKTKTEALSDGSIPFNNNIEFMRTNIHTNTKTYKLHIMTYDFTFDKTAIDMFDTLIMPYARIKSQEWSFIVSKTMDSFEEKYFLDAGQKLGIKDIIELEHPYMLTDFDEDVRFLVALTREAIKEDIIRDEMR